MFDDTMVVRDTARAIRCLHDQGIMYANIFSPLGDDQMNDALRRANVLCRLDDMGPREQELLTPPVFGRYVMTLSRTLNQPGRAFATRHGFGHVVAGHVAEITLLSTSRAWTTHEERVADLFALADVIPTWLIEQLRNGNTGWRPMRKLVKLTMIQHTVDWSDARLEDRAMLRIALYRNEGI